MSNLIALLQGVGWVERSEPHQERRGDRETRRRGDSTWFLRVTASPRHRVTCSLTWWGSLRSTHLTIRVKRSFPSPLPSAGGRGGSLMEKRP